MYKPQIPYPKFPSFCFGHTVKPECELVTGTSVTGHTFTKWDFLRIFKLH